MQYVVEIGEFTYGPFGGVHAASQWALSQPRANSMGPCYTIKELREPTSGQAAMIAAQVGQFHR